ncbi:tumor necrosis factor receptor superfamily member wengen [Anthonomus grandis grandis]|uniref:tumor necrosis factor receptor superfamily member wengen n=1 Tax=Anthonomus grandis grandis TaxID=2921223 RepID=UPI0021656D15|nr:tumor necrosis factor receptor superfamily member wengen [Anthonomus grandis grandis]
MADSRICGVAINAYIPYLCLLAVTITSVLASICPDNQYLNANEQICMNCTECSQGSVVLRPCELHRDTLCGPIIDILGTGSGNHHRHHHEKHRHEKHRRKEEEIIWRFGDEVQGKTLPPAALEVASSEAPFSSAETLVWDWQAIALTSAVFACILFFLVITLYSLHQARQWRRLKENFEADVEELSARLSLMAATSTEKCEFLEGCEGTNHTGSTPNSPASGDPNYLNTRCLYLEQLLSVRKEDEKNSPLKPKGNVYIEEHKNPKK